LGDRFGAEDIVERRSTLEIPTSGHLRGREQPPHRLAQECSADGTPGETAKSFEFEFRFGQASHLLPEIDDETRAADEELVAMQEFLRAADPHEYAGARG